MNFAFTEEQEQLRREVRDFLEAEIAQGTFQPREDAWMVGNSREFSRKLGQRGWIGMTWPKEYGGGGRSYAERLVVTEELLRYGAPVHSHWTADRQIGPALMGHGTEEQRNKFFPGIIRGDLTVAFGFSEPEAGSDLASLRTTAVEKDNAFVINGQKVWTSGALEAHYIYMLARTDPEASKHKGLSQFIVDTSLSGITINPLLDLPGHYHYCEVFFDNVSVPKTALVGEKNRGWYQVGESLVYERAGLERLMTNYPMYENLIKYVKETKHNGKKLSEIPWIRDRLAELLMKFEAGRLLVYRAAWLLDRVAETGYVPNWETAMAKTFCVDFEQQLANTATKIAGICSTLTKDSKWAPINGMIARSYLFSPGYSLQGGGSEILRGIVAMRGLGLPRG
ncbi:acyl-CoA dehydrogenase family protein [Chloroflexota bacterium]